MNGNSMREKIIQKIEDAGWAVHEGDGSDLEFEKHSPAGEDFIFSIEGNDIAAEVREYANDFDTDEHIEMWVTAKASGNRTRGIPDIKTLVQDADDIQQMLDDLADALDGIEEKIFREAVQSAVDDEYSGWCKKDESGSYVYEMYADYRDCMQNDTAIEILESDDPRQSFFDKLEEWYEEQAIDLEGDLREKISDILSEEDGLFPNGLTDEQEDELKEMLYEMVYFAVPADHYLKQQFCVNIMVDTGDGNYDYTLNSVYPCYCGAKGGPIDDKASLMWLARQQGYNKTQLRKALEKGDVKNPNGFLETVRQEVINLPSHMATLTFLVSMTLADLLDLNGMVKLQDRNGHHYDTRKNPYCGYIVIGKKADAGLYDPWSGGGSVLEIELEKDVKLPVKYIRSALPDGGDGYSIGSVYGLCGSAWKEDVVEICAPKKLKAKEMK